MGLRMMKRQDQQILILHLHMQETTSLAMSHLKMQNKQHLMHILHTQIRHTTIEKCKILMFHQILAMHREETYIQEIILSKTKQGNNQNILQRRPKRTWIL